MTVKDYSTTASSNTAINGVNINTGMPPSNVDNALRQYGKDIREVWNDKEWFEVGDGSGTTVVTRTGNTTVTIPTDVRVSHHVGRFVRIVGTNSGTIYSHISNSTYSSPNTTLTFASGTISSSDSTISLFLGSPYVNPSVSIIDEDSFSTNSAVLPPSQQSTKAFIESGTSTFTNKRLNSPKINEDVVMSATSTELNLLDGATVTTAEINYNDTGASVGTVVASKTVTADANKDVASFRNITLTGELDAGSLDVSGNADIDGTLETDGLSLNGTAITSTGAELNILDGVTANAGELNILDGVTATTSELNIMDGVTSTTAEINYTDGVTSNIQTQLDAKVVKASNLSDLASASTSRTNLGLGTISTQASNNISITGGAISGMSDPSSANQVATKNYVDSIATALSIRHVMKVATTGNISLSSDLQNGDSIDGISLTTGMKVLVKSQSNANENGVYLVVNSGTASRDPDYDNISELAGGIFTIQSGNTQAEFIYLCTSDNSGSLGSVAINFVKVTPNNSGTVTQVGLTQSGSEFTIGNTPITSSGNITLNVNRISATKIGANTNISDSEYGFLDGASSNIQNQLDAKATQGFAIALAVAL